MILRAITPPYAIILSADDGYAFDIYAIPRASHAT